MMLWKKPTNSMEVLTCPEEEVLASGFFEVVALCRDDLRLYARRLSSRR